MAWVLLALIVAHSLPGAASFAAPGSGHRMRRDGPALARRARGTRAPGRLLAMAAQRTWAPQDLTRDVPGRAPIPDDDYVKKYQRRPELWPVEFFVIVYRRVRSATTQARETQVLVRKSANGTSKWGLGTGVPATRWVLSSQAPAPRGYQYSIPPIRFEANNYPEFPIGAEPWAYDKIDLSEDAFSGPGAAELNDPELEEFAGRIRQGLRARLSEQLDGQGDMSSWDASTKAVVRDVLDRASSLAAIQGTLRMSGIFARKHASGPRYVDFGDVDPAKLAQSVRVYTMFPQMPAPMPLPSTSPEDLQREIAGRVAQMAESGRDPHEDQHGRKFTHVRQAG